MKYTCEICEKEVDGFLYKINGDMHFKGNCGHLSSYKKPKRKDAPGINFIGKGFHKNDYGSN